MGSAYRYVLFVGIAAIAAISGIIIMNLSDVVIATQDYDLHVDPILDKQNLFVMGRITIQNTGTQQLTNLRVNFGDGDTFDIRTLDPGRKIILSPPEGNSMQFVTVTADNDVVVSKAYRTPPKMVGMMGS